jgi:mRNA interferase YafQ
VLKTKFQVKFRKDFKKIKHRQGVIDELKIILEYLLRENKLPEKYKDHSLIGNYIGYHECRLKPDILLIYKTDKESLTLARIGSHSELFR